MASCAWPRNSRGRYFLTRAFAWGVAALDEPRAQWYRLGDTWALLLQRIPQLRTLPFLQMMLSVDYVQSVFRA